MKPKEILVIGAGIAGCAVALSLAKRGIPVTIVTSSFDQRTYHASFVKPDNLEMKTGNLKESCIQSGCSKAAEQLGILAKKSVEELLESQLEIDRYGNIDVHRCLQEQMKAIPHIEWANQHSVIELLTLEKHSLRKGDIYKRATCIGAYAYNYETQQVEQWLAKETILATGGATSLFPYSTHAATARGAGFSMAYRAGARVLNMDQILFHPLTLYARDKPSIPLPIELLKEGGKLHSLKNIPIEEFSLEPQQLSIQLYDELFKNKSDHLWLDLTQLDPIAIKDKYPAIDAYCLDYGFNIAKDLIPVAPAAQYTCGGVTVDRVGQTAVQRLRAIGEVACTGLVYDFRDEAINVLESLTWAVACAEDIAKQIHKFVYYFPELARWNRPVQTSSEVVLEDAYLLQQVMWHYAGIVRDYPRLKRGYALLRMLKAENDAEEGEAFSIDRMHLFNDLQTSLIIAEAALSRVSQRMPGITISEGKLLRV